MTTASLMLLVTLAAQPARTTPAEILAVCHFNDASVDAVLLNHVVDVTSPVETIIRDGIGGYIVRLEANVQFARFEGRSCVLCHFEGASREVLARIRPGREVTIRGVVRQVDDDSRRYVDPNVQVTMKRCEVVVGAE